VKSVMNLWGHRQEKISLPDDRKSASQERLVTWS